MYIGPKIETSGLVLNLDAANDRSFRGEPTTNLLTGTDGVNPGYILGTQDGIYFKSNYGSETVDIPSIGNRKSHYCNIYNDYNGGSGNCCPSLFAFGDISVSPSTTYTYQIIFKTTTGYSHPNYMYQYQYNGGTYVTEFGLLDGSRIQDLGDGWKHAWGTFTTNASTNRLITYLFHYEYGWNNKVQVAGIMLSQRSTPVDPKHILGIGKSIGTTVETGGGWADRSGKNNHGELVNGVTYNSSNLGGLVFDGVNDHILLPTNFFPYPSTTTFTISLWFKSSQTNGGTLFSQQSSTDPDNTDSYVPVIYLRSDGKIRIEPFWSGSTSNFILSSQNLNNNTWYNITILFNQGVNQLYVNGVYDTQQTGITLVSYTSSYYYIIGAGRSAGRNLGTNYFNGSISNFIFYNRVLTALEIQQNYNSTKKRYGL